MNHLALMVSVLILSGEQIVPQMDRVRITIVNEGQPSPYTITRFEAGPSVGDMVNNHFFPGIDSYNSGKYLYAQADLAYVVARPAYLEGNRRRSEFISTSHYLLGMIYMYHADGLGRRNVAREHFEKAIEWNPGNYMAYIELARVFAELRVTKQASAIIQRLLERNPPDDIAAEARNELDKFSSQDK